MGGGEPARVRTRGRKLLLTIGIIFVLIYPVTASATFLIRLKNGGELRTNRYWEEANRIMFYTVSGGVFGIQKSLVKDITALDSASQETVVEPTEDHVPPKDMTAGPSSDASTPPAAPQVTPPAVKEAEQTGDTGNTKIHVAYYRDKKRALQDKIDQATIRYREATTADPGAKEQARLDILELTKQTYELADELKQQNGGVLPDWWGQL